MGGEDVGSCSRVSVRVLWFGDLVLLALLSLDSSCHLAPSLPLSELSFLVCSIAAVGEERRGIIRDRCP